MTVRGGEFLSLFLTMITLTCLAPAADAKPTISPAVIAHLRLERKVIQLDIERELIERKLPKPITSEQRFVIQQIRLQRASLMLDLASLEMNRVYRYDTVDTQVTVVPAQNLSKVALPIPGLPVAPLVLSVPTSSLITPTPAIQLSMGERFQALSSLSISGYKNFDFSYAKGSRSTGLARSEALKLQVAGVSAGTTINVSIDQSSLGTQNDNKAQIEIVNPHFKAILGQFKTDFASLDLLHYNAQLDGVQTEFNLENHHGGFIYSTARGGRKKELIYGNNSQGPFIVKYRPVVGNSEQVMINGEILSRSVDYQIDYASGAIRLLKRIAVPEDQIQLSYESENDSFKDRISGAKYWGSQSDTTGIGLTWMQKNEQSDLGKTSAYLQRQLGILHMDQAWGSSNIHAEYGVSNGVDDLAYSQSGNAAALRGTSSWKAWTGSAYYQTVGSQFQSIDSAGLVSGDVKAGVTITGRVGNVDLSASLDNALQTLNGVPMAEQRLNAGASTRISSVNTTVSVQDMFHSESPSTGNKVADYRRRVTNATFQVPIPLGSISTQIGQETKKSFISTSDTFVATSLSGGVSITGIDHFNGAVEGTYKSLETGSGPQIETTSRLTSAYQFDSANTLSSVAEYRTRTHAFPIALMSVATDLRPNPTIGLTSKVNLENLRESVGIVDLDMDKWDIMSRLTVDPISAARFKLTGKLNSKIPKGVGIPPSFLNHDITIESTLSPFKTTTIGLQYNVRGQRRGQLRYYPDALFTESDDTSRTTIVRFLTTLGVVSVLGQYETETDRKEALITTSNPGMSVSQFKTDKFKGDISSQWGGFTIGTGVEAVRTYSEIPTRGMTLQNIYTAFTQWRPLEMITTKLSWSYINNFDTEEFISTQPALDIDVRLPIGTLTFKYRRLEEMRKGSRPISERWDINGRLDLNRNVALTLTVLREVHQYPDTRSLELNGRVLINF